VDAPVRQGRSIKILITGICGFAGNTVECLLSAVWINLCRALAGAGQFGTPNQGIFSYLINAHLRRRPLRYTGLVELTIRYAMHFIHKIW
jgi:hypothetical protein